MSVAVAPPTQSPMWARSLYGLLHAYRRTWRGSVAMNFLYPVLYLTAMGVGLGSLVNKHLAATHAASIGGVSYLTFIAPGILASSAMQIAVSEGTWPVMGRIRWERTYLAMLQTPLRVIDVLIGQIAFIVIRLLMTTAVFLVVMWAFGALHSAEALCALPIGALAGLAFATPCVGFSASQDNDIGFSTLNRLIVIPLFLFSGSFYPISQLPGALQVVAQATPLYHGVALARAATLGTLAESANLAHLAYLVALSAIGIVYSRRAFEKRLTR
jgi:lipooligosaccharide transport system permease protein